MSYINDRRRCDTELTKRIDAAVRRFNEDKEWRRWFVTFEQQLKEERYYAELEGIEKNRTQMIESMIRYGLDDSAISAIVKTMTADEIAAIRKESAQL